MTTRAIAIEILGDDARTIALIDYALRLIWKFGIDNKCANFIDEEGNLIDNELYLPFIYKFCGYYESLGLKSEKIEDMNQVFNEDLTLSDLLDQLLAPICISEEPIMSPTKITFVMMKKDKYGNGKFT